MSPFVNHAVNKLRVLTVGIATTVLVGSGMAASYADSNPAVDCTVERAHWFAGKASSGTNRGVNRSWQWHTHI